MKILLVADGRSPITHQWLKTITGMGYEVALVSTFPCGTLPGVVEQTVIPVAFSGMAGTQVAGSSQKRKKSSSLVRKARKQLMHVRYWLGPLTLPDAGKNLQETIAAWQPDLVHALRIPFEGMLASYTPASIPLVISIWGNDLTLHSRGSASMRRWTRKALQRADGLLADASRDLRLGVQWGFEQQKPALVVPGSGGIDLAEILLSKEKPDVSRWVSSQGQYVINPRGLRPGYINTCEFFQAAQLVLLKDPNVTFLCPAMEGQEEALQYAHQYHVEKNVLLLPYLTQSELWQLFRVCQVSVSISTHDGTPNTLLEAMSCGCFPIAGDLESLREWITPGVNGFLVDSYKPDDIARAILTALEAKDLREKAKAINAQRIFQNASRVSTREKLKTFFDQVRKPSL
ncbi:MAG: glycosyltransferase [Anaerolineaceae bacterium]